MDFPKPTFDPVNAAMLSAWSDRGELMLQRCGGCGHTFFYPRKRCPACWSADLEDRASEGAGQIVTFSVIHRGVDEAFRRQGVPVALAVVQLGEGPQIITRIVTEALSDVNIGHKVRLFEGDDRSGYPLPVFTLSET